MGGVKPSLTSSSNRSLIIDPPLSSLRMRSVVATCGRLVGGGGVLGLGLAVSSFQMRRQDRINVGQVLFDLVQLVAEPEQREPFESEQLVEKERDAGGQDGRANGQRGHGHGQDYDCPLHHFLLGCSAFHLANVASHWRLLSYSARSRSSVSRLATSAETTSASSSGYSRMLSLTHSR